jgi:endonuclease-3 related protein
MELDKIIAALEKQHAGKWEAENGRTIHEWWPVSGCFLPKQLEIAAGAILTQNTNWKNVEKAIAGMIAAGMTDAEAIAKCSRARLERTVKPAGFYRQKAGSLKVLCRYILEFKGDFYRDATREQLLSLKGIGNETADAILLFACDKAEFVIDAYTKRIFSRHGIFSGNEKYAEMKEFFESRLKKDARSYRKIHALIDEHAKQICRKKAECEKCMLTKCVKDIR